MQVGVAGVVVQLSLHHLLQCSVLQAQLLIDVFVVPLRRLMHLGLRLELLFHLGVLKPIVVLSSGVLELPHFLELFKGHKFFLEILAVKVLEVDEVEDLLVL